MNKKKKNFTTQAIEDYLKTIHVLQTVEKKVSTSAIAGRIGVAQASVTGMLKKLDEMKLVEYSPYQGVSLTPAGEKIALEVIRHHRLLELYLAQAMGYSWDQVHDEAEQLEHYISEEFEDKMDQVLGQPTIDPHGSPIPTKDGVLPNVTCFALSQAQTSERVVVRMVSDRDPARLRYLAQVGIFPQTEILVLDKAPFNGPLHLQIQDQTCHLGKELADAILVDYI
ncbi:metal-dependent transcriptional regulator [candidate division KSB1 bacterium]|nr:MAG: metal-dependent transcriptional regulator [candidate division KSB1 bacterium]MBC6946943.1 metal-dependent transcriptional regulator [candidate division KSB1 bacterium]MCE7942326.1 metal-dependent transcriptional regulator [Chlorobi bacterium CHB1]MDL1875314.1 metal-dependent transcriptional regulator [Cytophagia bacterium CHB2]